MAHSAQLRGNCYVAAEALYHILGGKRAGWKAMHMHTPGDVHWFLKHTSGMILDPSVKQFKRPPDYTKARGSGFLTRRPSKRAQALIQELTWQRVKNVKRRVTRKRSELRVLAKTK